MSLLPVLLLLLLPFANEAEEEGVNTKPLRFDLENPIGKSETYIEQRAQTAHSFF